jgi:hypothetical protein
MTRDQIIAAVRKYDGWLAAANITVAKIDLTIAKPTREQALGHLRWMFVEIGDSVAGVPGKADRWVGFVQGVLWANGFGSIEEFKGDNR